MARAQRTLPRFTTDLQADIEAIVARFREPLPQGPTDPAAVVVDAEDFLDAVFLATGAGFVPGAGEGASEVISHPAPVFCIHMPVFATRLASVAVGSPSTRIWPRTTT